MGQELACNLRYQRRTLSGKAYLETDFVLFRGEERLKIPFRDLTSVTASGGDLKLEFDGGPAVFELGAAAEKWAQKILHPPSRIEKLGVKAGLTAAVEGPLGDEFLADLRREGVALAGGRSKADLLFFAASQASDLARAAKLAARLKPAGALWIVYPKGVTAIREIDVLQAGRAAGLKDTKVASFSATHTALRFVIPVDQRHTKLS